jgi:hypothetical protein
LAFATSEGSDAVLAQPGNGGDDEALAALHSVGLDSFNAEPSMIAPSPARARSQ